VEEAGACDVLHHISFTLHKGETMAIVGPSGGGKSTLVDLLPRFYDIRFGEILIDGKPHNLYTLSDLRGLFGIVNQDVFLFDDTVYHNIAFGMESVTEEQVVAAAKIAQAHDFIMELEDGYQTRIGNRGMRLSGGQRQRISIARAILRQPQIIILDEATSALDNESEHLFQEALMPYVRQHTGIIIAHRLSTIRFADKIIFLKDGRIAESGTHQELMEKEGDYYRFYTVQQMA
jgi:ABC-type multidrug transport system fused ATPase/permease subunit